MIYFFLKKIKFAFLDLDKNILKIIKNGLIFCLFILLISISILTIYLLFVHNVILYQIGILILQISLYFSIDFIISGFTIDIIRKQIF